MAIFSSLLGVFILAAAAPWLHRALGKATGWVLALAPLAFAALLLSHASDIAQGTSIRESVVWVPALDLSISIAVDGLGLLFALLITGVGALILIYTQGYLEEHPHLPRIYAYLLMFMGSMLGIVLTDNLLAMFVFWELTSISSYLLIGFDHNRPAARRAALQALLVTGGGGLALLVGVLLLGAVGQSYDVSTLIERSELIKGHDLYVPIVALFAFGAFTKSAQFPFHFWLPGAMEAPTPVSAYLHSSTMVKAGIYLLARMTPVLGDTQLWMTLLTVAGAVTMTLGIVLAFRQTYLKLLLAYSTVSSLGLIVLALGIGTNAAIQAAIAYLLAHALFKGALFMIAGAIDHGTGERHVERLGGLARAMPILAICGVCAALSMAGFLPFFGFVGKELFLKSLFSAPNWRDWLLASGVLTALITVTIAILTGIKPFFGQRLPTPEEPHAPSLALVAGPGVLALLGLAMAFLPGTLATWIVGPASAVVLADAANPDLSLWHGWTLPLALSALAIVGGIALFFLRRPARSMIELLRPLDRIGPARAYDASIRAINVIASTQTSILQNGYLRSYLFVTIAVTASLVGFTLWTRSDLTLIPQTFDVRWYELSIGVIIAVAAVAAAVARTRLTAIAALGLAGYGVSIMFVVYGAPDLAMTQIAIETLTVILFVLVFLKLPDFRSISSRGQKIRDLIIAVSAGALMTSLVLLASRANVEKSISPWFGQNSLSGGYGRNVVNVILVDFRALDTLGEITVLAIAAIGVYSLLRPRRVEKGVDS